MQRLRDMLGTTDVYAMMATWREKHRPVLFFSPMDAEPGKSSFYDDDSPAHLHEQFSNWGADKPWNLKKQRHTDNNETPQP